MLSGLLLGGAGHAAAQQSTALSITQTTGRAEVQESGGVWQPLTQGRSLTAGLRTGAGRVTVKTAEAEVLVGSASRLRVYQQEPDFQEGQFLFTGAGGFFALGWHMNVEPGGRVRIDLPPSGSPRIAVLQGRVRVSGEGRLLYIRAGEQVTLPSGQVAAFTENDPWYSAQFVGPGNATIEALRGQVQFRSGGASRVAKRGQTLAAGDNLTTGAGAWVEIGFTGGGYLRLTENSELSVVAIDKTARGREVTLRLLRGSAWNVVQKGQGGYRITTPVVSTAVRGTTFRVDTNGTVKVFDGQVELPSHPGITLQEGMEKRPGQAPQPLTLDELDRLNLQLDRERAQPLTLQVQLPTPARVQQQLQLQIKTLPDSDVTLQLGPQQFTLVETGEGGVYGLPPELPALPEGAQQVTLTVRRFGQVQQRQLTLRIDRTAPLLRGLDQDQQGRVLTLSGELQEQPGQRTEVRLTLPGGQMWTRWLPAGPFRIVLPAPEASGPVRLLARDPAGNEAHVELP